MDILMIGYGAIGRYVAKHLADHCDARIRWVLCRPGRNACVTDQLGRDVIPVNSPDQINEQIGLALECAGQDALAEHGPGILERGIDLLAVSSGALADDAVAARLEEGAQSGGARLQIVSGAVGAIDALSAAKIGRLQRLTYRGAKPPQSWLGSHAENVVDLRDVREPVCHFKGSARDAARLYPKNANIAASIALAGPGMDATRVELIADPGISSNRHELEVEGDFGRFSFRIEGNPLPDNPRSSALTAMSIVRAICNRQAKIFI